MINTLIKKLGLDFRDGKFPFESGFKKGFSIFFNRLLFLIFIVFASICFLCWVLIMDFMLGRLFN